MSFNKINNIVGWIVTVIACSVYILTAEAGGSLWDCGEFISSCFKLQIPHPPGAPLFVILGRVFIVLFGNDPATAAKAVNVMSALASGFTILFLFWTITHFARKIVQKGKEILDASQIFTIMAAGVVGALAYTFSDSFWFSAVEGEVYALSSFFTALVFWMMLKWEHSADEPGADRWIILIFFMMGLSIGVHLLNLLTIPAIVMIYYYRKYKVTKMGTFIAFLIGCLITGVVQKAVIQYTIKAAGKFDILFVNSFGLPFFSGFITFFVLLAVVVYLAIRYAESGKMKSNVQFMKLGLWSFVFMLLGYSTYVTTMVRSAANPAIDMYNVDNPMSLEGYLGREQYGDFPLLYGQVFTARPSDYKEGEMKYVKGKDNYIAVGREQKPVYESSDMMFLPRVWDASNDQGHATFYQRWLNLEDGEKPTMIHNISWALSYQIGWMYLRYFGWNFIGKQNDIQGFGNKRDGNSITGVSAVDNAMLGNQDKIPSSIRNNKANNKLFALPLILGILGILYQYKKDKNGSFVSFLLFFFTGLAIVFYLNQAGNQPRERDYAYVGSFYAFAIWIGLGVMQVKDWLAKFTSQTVANATAALVCLLAVPVLMAAEEWDDHDRSKKQIARDLAKNYLESCAPNAILFTFGDNDTYPLWYAQEVEGIRKDIRVINYSLLGIDWYINQMRYKVNESAPIDVIWGADKIEGGKRDYIRFYEREGLTDQNRYVELYSLMNDFVGSDDQAAQVQMQDGTWMNYLPVKKVSVPVDIAKVRKNGTVEATDSVASDMRFEIPKDILMKNDLAVLNIIAANKWERPIYFTSPFGELGFGQYLRNEGQSYRLVPVAGQNMVNARTSYDVLKNKFAFGSANIPGVYFDEENRRHLVGIRQSYAEAANQLALQGDSAKARELLQIADKNLLEENIPYAMVSRQNQHNTISVQFVEAAYKAGDKKLATKVSAAVMKDVNEQLAYYAFLGDMSVPELLQAVQDILSNKADNLSNEQRQIFIEIRQAIIIQEYLRNLESVYK
ncbi:MAG: hypothetical protein RLZZ595_1278 [Bacteroidota bacterium]|jgi:uncharacterized membrane protein